MNKFHRYVAAFLAAAFLLSVPGAAAATPGGKAAPVALQFIQQTETAGPVDNPVLLDSTSNLIEGGTYLSDPIDVRAYNSFGLNIEVQNGGGATFLSTDLWELRLSFYADAAATTLLFWDVYTMYPTNILGSQPIRFTDQMHGAYVTVMISNVFAVPRTMRITHAFYGSFRQMSAPYFRASPDAQLFDRGTNLAAAANDGGRHANMGYGWAMATLESGAGGGATMDIRLNGVTAAENRYRLIATAANTRVTQQIILPKKQAWVIMTNNGAAASTVRGSIYNLIQPA